MLHNFVHFKLDDVNELVKMGLPVNKPFYTDLQDEITDTVEKMEWSRSAWNPDIIPPAAVLFEQMLEKIAEEQTSDNSSYGNPKKQNFELLRTRIYISPGDWSVEKMAEFMHLTRTYFSKVYKDTFGITPKADLSEAAIMYAERTLILTDLPVAEIAKNAGYSAHASHFISLFKAKYGLTPEQYRRQNGKKRISEGGAATR
jgi:AraC-like DNA-binding protein